MDRQTTHAGDGDWHHGAEDLRAAATLIDRWRQRGFDLVLCHPSGYCSPGNSAVVRANIPDGYVAFSIDSNEAFKAVLHSVARRKVTLVA